MAEVKKTKILNYINVFRGLAILLILMYDFFSKERVKNIETKIYK